MASFIVEQQRKEEEALAEIKKGWMSVARRILNLVPTELAVWREYYFRNEATMPEDDPVNTNQIIHNIIATSRRGSWHVLNFRDDGGPGFKDLDDVVAKFDRLAMAWSGIIEVKVEQYKDMGHVTVKFRASGF